MRKAKAQKERTAKANLKARAGGALAAMDFKDVAVDVGKVEETFFCSNALIALARSLCKCLLAVLITASEADAVTGFLVRGASQYDTIPRREKQNTATKPTQQATKPHQNKTKQKTKTPQEPKHHEVE